MMVRALGATRQIGTLSTLTLVEILAFVLTLVEILAFVREIQFNFLLIPFMHTLAVSALRHLHVISVGSSTPANMQRELKAALARFHGATRVLSAQLGMGHRAMSTGTPRGGKVRIFSCCSSFLLLWLRNQHTVSLCPFPLFSSRFDSPEWLRERKVKSSQLMSLKPSRCACLM
jgi:hypothetical protein